MVDKLTCVQDYFGRGKTLFIPVNFEAVDENT